MEQTTQNKWALILGASSGFGAAVSRELARNGFNILGIHLDRKNTLPLAEQVKQDVMKSGREALFINMNASDEEKRKEALDSFEAHVGSGEKDTCVKLVLHSLAFGTLKPFIAENPADCVTKAQMDMTLDVMANSLVYWVQDLALRRLIGRGSRVFAMTSAGSQRVWKTYGAVSAAKAALESHIRQLALELAPLGVTCNAILAGVTDTPALRKIPGYEIMIKTAAERNPFKRLTTPEDIAKALVAFSNSSTEWMTANTIRIDGGETVVD
ncbi:MAG: SDR family oxidoreductase [Candidatus Omnitrophica bacterium]|nr:SDR family oxidoreductase [Candidatus Omnitrophota bacterium]